MMLVLNWKMNPGRVSEAKALMRVTKKYATLLKKSTVVVVPPAVFLGALSPSGKVALGAQDIHEADGGAHTGDTSAIQAQSVGARYALVGHAERRALGETDERIALKVAQALARGLTPIICIGESVRDPHGAYLEHVRTQLLKAVAKVEKKHFKKLVIAYEPVWAIGAAEPMKPAHMHEMAILIRKVLMDIWGKPALSVPVLYGGSVTAESALVMVREGDVAGLLVGRASAETAALSALLNTLKNV